MRKIAMLAAASTISAPMAFANADSKTTKTPAAPDAATTDAKPKADRINPEIAAIRTDIPIPSRPNNRGSKSAFDFDALAVGGSFGVKNVTAAKMAPKVSRANRLAMVKKTDANGAVVYKTTELKGADGATTTVPSNEPEMIKGKNFFVVDTDPKADPDGAISRVFRDA